MHLTENWRLKGPRYTLTTTRDKDTQKVTFPPRSVASREIDIYEFDVREDAQRQPEVSVSEGLAQ